MAHKYTFEEVETYLRSLPRLKFGGQKVFQDGNKKVLLLKILALSCIHDTFVEGYEMERECHPGAYRSIGDLYRLYTYYWDIVLPTEKVSFKEFFDMLMWSVQNELVSSVICGGINRRVYYFGNWEGKIIVNGELTDEFGHDLSCLSGLSNPHAYGYFYNANTIHPVQIERHGA